MLLAGKVDFLPPINKSVGNLKSLVRYIYQINQSINQSNFITILYPYIIQGIYITSGRPTLYYNTLMYLYSADIFLKHQS